MKVALLLRMMRNSSAIEAMILPTVEALGYELWGCVDLRQGLRRILRVYIDNQQGIKLADCERVSRQITAVFDVEHPSLAQYNLEVSSPGLDRPLFTTSHFERFVGHSIRVQIGIPVVNQRRFKGLLKSASEEGIVLDQDGETIALTWGNIMRANVLPEIIK
jgi:ribosome maturation factor RimP